MKNSNHLRWRTANLTVLPNILYLREKRVQSLPRFYFHGHNYLRENLFKLHTEEVVHEDNRLLS